MTTLVPNNPYVGPRSIKAGEAFFGRDREARSLTALLVAERIVLLHSPSGAGKSSLIQAGLMPQMEARFRVLPLVRVNLEPPTEVRALPGLNRYILSTLLSLEEGQPSARRLPLETLAALTLDAYLEQCPRFEISPDNDLLLFDQFEEVLTVSPTDQAAKQAFFEQLGEALQNRRRWALFAIREDYMGGLAPYVRAIPNRLGVTFRLSLLGPEAARLAIQQPARNHGVNFTDSAAETLVTDLRRIQVQQPDGSFAPEEGPFVEPVQLQVVCFNLWQSHAADDKLIDEGDLQRVGNVDQALSSYYANGVLNVGKNTGIDERIIRQWFGEHLITPDGIRSQVLKGAEKTEELPNIALRLLEDTHLVRAETRTGKTWYELSHDRLVGPVLSSNAEWFERNLSLFQRQTILWIQKGRSDGLLLRGNDLKQAEQENRETGLTPDEQEYLDACRKLRDNEKRESRRNRLVGLLAIGATIALVIAVIFYFQSQQASSRNSQLLEEQQQKNSELQNTLQSLAQAVKEQVKARVLADELAKDAAKQARISRARELSALAIGQGNAWPQRRLLLSLAAMQILQPGDPNVPELDDALREAVAGFTANIPLFPEAGPIYALAFRDSQYFASSGQDGIVRFWDIKNLGQPTRTLSGSTQPIRVLAFSEDGNWLAAGGDDGQVYLWEIGNPTAQVKVGKGHTAPLRALAFSKNGKFLVSGGDDRDLSVWSTADLTQPLFVLSGLKDEPNASASPTATPNPYNPPQAPKHHQSAISEIYFISATEFRSVSEDGIALTWAVDAPQFHQTNGGSNGTTISRTSSDLYLGGSYQGLAITALTKIKNVDAYFTDYDDRVVGTNEGVVLVVPRWSGRQAKTLVGHERAIYSVAASADGAWIVSGGEEGIIRLWPILPKDQSYSSLSANFLFAQVDQIHSLSFDQNSQYLAVSGTDGETQIWNWKDLKQKPVNFQGVSRNYSSISGDGRWLALVSSDNYYFYGQTALSTNQGRILKLIDLQNPEAEAVTLSQNASLAPAFSPDNHWLAYQDKNQIILYDLAVKQKTQLKSNALDSQIISLAFSPDSRWLVSADWASEALLWDLNLPDSGPKGLGKFAYPFYSLAFSPSGKYLAAGDTWGSLLIWNFSNLLAGQSEPLRLFEPGCEGTSAAIDFNPDETMLAQSCNNSIFLRAMGKAFKIQAVFNPAQGQIYQAKFSPDGNYLAIGGESSAVYLYPVGRTVLENAPCALARRNLTRQEWVEFFQDEPYRTICPQWPTGK